MKAEGRDFTLWHGDCVTVLKEMPSDSVHLTVTSPPYLSLFVYSDDERDMGNCRSDDEFWQGFEFLIAQLLRVTKPGRWKDPLIEATRSKALGLMHKQLMKDSAMCRAGLAQYLLAFRKPGDNPEPVPHEDGLDMFYGEQPPASGNLSHERWRRYASPVWMDIDFTDTLNVSRARDNDDERHLCPMARGLIQRALHLWSNPGDLVLDPFSGVGSTGCAALEMPGLRRFVGVELKRSYFDQACANLRAVESRPRSLFG